MSQQFTQWIEQQFMVMKPWFEQDDGTALDARKPCSKSKNNPNFNARHALKRVVGLT